MSNPVQPGSALAETLGRRAVKAKAWRWMPRMVDTDGYTFVEHRDCGDAAWLWVADDGCEALPIAGRLPDLTDAATLGCIEHGLLPAAFGRDVWLEPRGYQPGYGWQAVLVDDSGYGSPFGMGASRVEAMVAALEAAP